MLKLLRVLLFDYRCSGTNQKSDQKSDDESNQKSNLKSDNESNQVSNQESDSKYMSNTTASKTSSPTTSIDSFVVLCFIQTLKMTAVDVFSDGYLEHSKDPEI